MGVVVVGAGGGELWGLYRGCVRVWMWFKKCIDQGLKRMLKWGQNRVYTGWWGPEPKCILGGGGEEVEHCYLTFP